MEALHSREHQSYISSCSAQWWISTAVGADKILMANLSSWSVSSHQATHGFYRWTNNYEWRSSTSTCQRWNTAATSFKQCQGQRLYSTCTRIGLLPMHYMGLGISKDKLQDLVHKGQLAPFLDLEQLMASANALSSLPRQSVAMHPSWISALRSWAWATSSTHVASGDRQEQRGRHHHLGWQRPDLRDTSGFWRRRLLMITV